MVAPAKPGLKLEPVAENLIATLIHPDRQASIQRLQFSEDGNRLFTAGYPSGIVQIWDWAAKKELGRIDSPPGLRSSYNYAVLSHDWKTLYVPIESKKVTSSEKDGKVVQRLEYSGRIGVWDIATGQERAPIRLPPGFAPFYAVLSPDGRHLLTSERQSFSVGETRRGGVWSWDLQTGARRKVWDGMDYPRFTPDGKTVSFTVNDWEARVFTLKLLDFATGKESASFPCPEKGVIMLGGEFSPDGSILMATMSPLKGGCATILFLDGRTLAERGRLRARRTGRQAAGRFQVHARWQVVPDSRRSRNRPPLGPGLPEGSPFN